MAIVGGMGSIFGPLIGAFTLALVNHTTTELIGKAPALSMALYGLLLIVMVTFLPNGLIGGLIGGLTSLARRLGLRQRSGKDD